MNRERNFNDKIIPSAFRWELHSCGHCPNIHLILFLNEGGDSAFAEAVIGRDEFHTLIVRGNELLDRIRRENIARQNDA